LLIERFILHSMAIISFKYHFIFIHNPKVAGRSIKKALEKYSNNSRLGKRIYFLSKFLKMDYPDVARSLPVKLVWPPRHSKARDLQTMLPKENFDFFKFALVRNPWDWHVSMYYFMKTSKNHPRHHEVAVLSNFEEFLEWWIYNGVQLQKDFVTDDRGNIIVDYIGRFENLLKDFNDVCVRIGITADLPHKNKSNHKNYRSYYNHRTKAMIRFHAGEDIEFFKYGF